MAGKLKGRLAPLFALGLALFSNVAAAQGVRCDLSSYKAQDGLTAAHEGSDLVVGWRGEGGRNLRLRLSVDGGVPTIDELALRRGDGPWQVVARDATPEYSVTTGLRRISKQQLYPLEKLGIPITQEVLDKYRWDPFVDAPLQPRVGARASIAPPAEGIPGTDQPGLPRRPDEIRRAEANFSVSGCDVASEGARLTITYPGVTLGPFKGSLRYTVFKGTNLIRQEVVATTQVPWVAYKYDAGLKGLAIASDSGVGWRDVSGSWQEHRFADRQLDLVKVPLRAANRLAIANRGAAGSLAVFPPPHKFFWARNSAVVMGYNWYRRDSATSFAIGIRQNETEEPTTADVWPLYGARPGTEQLMTMFIYPSDEPAEDASQQALAFTNGDRYPALQGYKVMTHHHHIDLGELWLKAKNPALAVPDIELFKSVGIDIASPVEAAYFTAIVTPGDPEAEVAIANAKGRPGQLETTASAAAGARLVSDDEFLLMVSQEVGNSPIGGHTDLLFSHPVYWDSAIPGQPFVEPHPTYGKVYHIASAADFMKMAEAENILISMPHPRTKGSTGFPEAVKDEWYFRHPAYHGVGLRWGMGLDGSERRTCEYRCLPLMDDMANWLADEGGPLKYGIAISELRRQSPGDDFYGGNPVTYVRLDQLPPPDDTSPVIEALRRGEMFISTGEVLVPYFEIRGTGDRRTVVADVQWTFPLEMVEIVWGDGKQTGRQVIPATHLPPFGKHRFEIPFDARGKKWIRFAAWDVAYEGAILQPQILQ